MDLRINTHDCNLEGINRGIVNAQIFITVNFSLIYKVWVSPLPLNRQLSAGCKNGTLLIKKSKTIRDFFILIKKNNEFT